MRIMRSQIHENIHIIFFRTPLFQMLHTPFAYKINMYIHIHINAVQAILIMENSTRVDIACRNICIINLLYIFLNIMCNQISRNTPKGKIL